MIEVMISDGDIDELEIEHNASKPDPQRHWHFDERRRHVIKSWDDVQACPGSGKTTLVAAKLLILAKKWEARHSGICVLTHTNVARDEIVSRLIIHPSGFKLTSYPHFIGTIQEFTNRHLGLPYVRARYEFKRLIEDTEGQLEVRRARINGHTIRQICGNLYHTCNKADYEDIKNYLGSLHFLNAHGDLRFFKQNNSPEISLATSTSSRRAMLSSLKDSLCNAGIFQFRDMYAFADKLIAENPELVPTLRMRFPLVLIDEMQDTQKFQDTLVNLIFDHESVWLQRLGDPDQAIFDGIGGEEPNDSYNDNPDLDKILIKTTHRFGNDICDKIIGLSYTKVGQLTSDRDPVRGDHPHTIFLYDDATRERVLDAFGELVTQADPENNWLTLKAVGGVEGSGEVGHISKYWSKFDRSKSVSSPKPKKLIHIAHLCRDQSEGHRSSRYQLLVQGIVDLLRKANVKTENKDGNRVYFSRQSLNGWLREKEKFFEFKKLLTSLMLDADLTPYGWAEHVAALKAVLELDALTAEANEYLAHDAEAEAVDDNAPATNTYTCANGREIEVGTIHSVKGETHDATLILETKLRKDDLQEMLPHFIDASIDSPTIAWQKNFMRKLYVAGSRPRHLLCLALHKDHVDKEKARALVAQGWRLTVLPRDDGNA